MKISRFEARVLPETREELHRPTVRKTTQPWRVERDKFLEACTDKVSALNKAHMRETEFELFKVVFQWYCGNPEGWTAMPYIVKMIMTTGTVEDLAAFSMFMHKPIRPSEEVFVWPHYYPVKAYSHPTFGTFVEWHSVRDEPPRKLRCRSDGDIVQMLLVMAGVEQNPGPPKEARRARPEGNGGKSTKQPTQHRRAPKTNRADTKANAVAAAVRDAQAQAKGAEDAFRELARESPDSKPKLLVKPARRRLQIVRADGSTPAQPTAAEVAEAETAARLQSSQPVEPSKVSPPQSSEKVCATRPSAPTVSPMLSGTVSSSVRDTAPTPAAESKPVPSTPPQASGDFPNKDVKQDPSQDPPTASGPDFTDAWRCLIAKYASYWVHQVSSRPSVLMWVARCDPNNDRHLLAHLRHAVRREINRSNHPAPLPCRNADCPNWIISPPQKSVRRVEGRSVEVGDPTPKIAPDPRPIRTPSPSPKPSRPRAASAQFVNHQPVNLYRRGSGSVEVFRIAPTQPSLLPANVDAVATPNLYVAKDMSRPLGVAISPLEMSDDGSSDSGSDDEEVEIRVERMVSSVTFRGVWDPEHPTFSPDDPPIQMDVYDSGRVVIDGRFPVPELTIPQPFFAVASRASMCADPLSRMSNILAGFHQHKACADLIQKDPIYYATHLSMIAFLLVSYVVSCGRLMWVQRHGQTYRDVTRYTVEPPPNWKELLPSSCKIFDDLMPLEARDARMMRMAPVVCSCSIPAIPSFSERWSIISALIKRLYPPTPAPKPAALRALDALSDELVSIINRLGVQPADPEAIFAEAVKKHTAADAAQMRKGFDDYMNPATRANAIAVYRDTPVKFFGKQESYPDNPAARKPMRFIACRPLYCRGVQVAAMGPVLSIIEQGTAVCNVKHLTSDQITDKLAAKLEHVGLCAETDFSSFESCITYELKEHVEHRVFRALASPDSLPFIDQAMRVPFIRVHGPSFKDDHFHHIRLSGDLWTSIGNLLTNLIVSAYANEKSVGQLMNEGLFEGDDGVYPAPVDSQRVIDRALDCGCLLKLDIAPWRSLSFCGNQFHELPDGTIARWRDPVKTLANLCTLFGADIQDMSADLTLQRSKILSMLSGPWVAGVSAFAAAFEWWSRSAKVSTQTLFRRGLLKEWSPYGTEECVPTWLRTIERRHKVVKEIYRHDQRAGGTLTRSDIDRMIDQFASGTVDVPVIANQSTQFMVYKDGVRNVGHTKHGLPIAVDRYQLTRSLPDMHRVVDGHHLHAYPRAGLAPREVGWNFWSLFRRG